MKATTYRNALRFANIVCASLVIYETDFKRAIKFIFLAVVLIFVLPGIISFIYELFFEDKEYDGTLYIDRLSDEVDHYRFVINRDVEDLDEGDEFTIEVKNEEIEE